MGKDIVHRFVNNKDEEELWAGKVTSYNHAIEKHTLTYTGDTEAGGEGLEGEVGGGRAGDSVSTEAELADAGTH